MWIGCLKENVSSYFTATDIKRTVLEVSHRFTITVKLLFPVGILLGLNCNECTIKPQNRPLGRFLTGGQLVGGDLNEGGD